jgi:hypothetical protein
VEAKPTAVANGRGVAFAVLAGFLLAYYAAVESLWNASLWNDVAWLALVLIPAMFALVWLALPLAQWRGAYVFTLGLVAIAAVTTWSGPPLLANFAKLAAVSFVGFLLLQWLESLSLVLLVAAIIPFVDAWSVWRGPTHVIVTQRKEIFTKLSVAFPTPGDHGSANLGLPDVLFFAVFLAATVRFRLRTPWTWLLMTASFGAAMAISVALDLGGLPALPGLSLALVLPNADLLWRRFRSRRERAEGGASDDRS